MATKQELIDNPESCWNKAAADEPLFVLRAQDLVAPAVVRVWAELTQAMTGNIIKPGEARMCADAMARWPTRKLPD